MLVILTSTAFIPLFTNNNTPPPRCPLLRSTLKRLKPGTLNSEFSIMSLSPHDSVIPITCEFVASASAIVTTAFYDSSSTHYIRLHFSKKSDSMSTKKTNNIYMYTNTDKRSLMGNCRKWPCGESSCVQCRLMGKRQDDLVGNWRFPTRPYSVHCALSFDRHSPGGNISFATGILTAANVVTHHQSDRRRIGTATIQKRLSQAER